jgi:hypothetical protein
MFRISFVRFVAMGRKFFGALKGITAKRQPRTANYYVGQHLDELESRQMLSACNPAPPPHTQSPVTVSNHVVTIHGTVGSDSIFIAQVGNVTEVDFGSDVYQISGVCGIYFDGRNNAASSTDNVFIDGSVRARAIKLDAGAGGSNFENDSCSPTLFVGSTGTDNFVGALSTNIFVNGTGTTRVEARGILNEVDCSYSANSSTDITVSNLTFVLLGNGGISLFENDNSLTVIEGTRAEFADLTLSGNGCTIEIVERSCH